MTLQFTQLARILEVVTQNRDVILRSWYEHFADRGPL